MVNEDLLIFRQKTSKICLVMAGLLLICQALLVFLVGMNGVTNSVFRENVGIQFNLRFLIYSIPFVIMAWIIYPNIFKDMIEEDEKNISIRGTKRYTHRRG